VHEQLGMLGVFLHRHVARCVATPDGGRMPAAGRCDRASARLAHGSGGSGIGDVDHDEGAGPVQLHELRAAVHALTLPVVPELFYGLDPPRSADLNVRNVLCPPSVQDDAGHPDVSSSRLRTAPATPSTCRSRTRPMGGTM
jgi:hypothetical protein